VINTIKFKKGDKVTCITKASRLIVGNRYTIIRTDYPFVQVMNENKLLEFYSGYRFQIIKSINKKLYKKVLSI